MKNKSYLLLFLLFYPCFTYAQGEKSYNLILKGSVVGKHTHSLDIDYVNAYGRKIYKKIYVRNGSFLFKANISSPVECGILNNKKINTHADVSNYTEIFLSPGYMTVSLKEDDFDNAKITGSVMQDDWNNLIKQEEPTQQKKLALYNKSWEISSGGNTPKNHAAVMSVGAKIDSLEELIIQTDYRFALTHPNSYVSAYLLNDCIPDLKLDSIEMLYNTFLPAVKNSVAGRSIERKIAYSRASAPGSMAPLFTRVDINGKKIDLKSFRNKTYLILEFWASWCQCDDNTRLKNWYSKYHNKGLEIIAVSTDFGDLGLKDTIKQHATNMWYHIIESTTSKYSNALEKLYNIKGMPPSTIFLIDKEGKIIGRYYGSINQDFEKDIDDGTLDDLDKKLTELFAANNKL